MIISWGLFALVLIAASALYIFVRWRHSPKAFKAMIAVSVASLVAGSILGACVYRFTEQRVSTALPRPLASASPLPSPGFRLPSYEPSYAALPDPRFTPGDILPAVTASDVCTPGWATDHRHVTEEMRAQVYAEYGFDYDQCQGPKQSVGSLSCEVDHLVPLELGGSNDLKNLWPQPFSCANRQLCAVYDPRPGAAEKDQLENELHNLVCAGRMSLADAQHCIASNWVACWQKYVASKFATVSK